MPHAVKAMGASDGRGERKRMYQDADEEYNSSDVTHPAGVYCSLELLGLAAALMIGDDGMRNIEKRERKVFREGELESSASRRVVDHPKGWRLGWLLGECCHCQS